MSTKFKKKLANYKVLCDNVQLDTTWALCSAVLLSTAASMDLDLRKPLYDIEREAKRSVVCVTGES